jgi:hypothetical protein
MYSWGLCHALFLHLSSILVDFLPAAVLGAKFDLKRFLKILILDRHSFLAHNDDQFSGIIKK